METQSNIASLQLHRLSDQDLQKILNDHPYFQLGQLEWTKRLRKANHIDALKSSRKTAILFSNRARLFELIQEEAEAEVEAGVDVPVEREKSTDNLKEDHTVNETLLETDKVEILKEEELKDKALKALESNYLAEAVNLSLQKEASNYSIEEVFSSKKQEDEKILSFSEWLQNKQPQDELGKNELIDKFIQEDPKIKRLEEKEFYSPSQKGKASLQEDQLVYSETLAAIFLDQGNKDLAIKAYHHLMLKNPQKSVYFADLIKKLEEKI